MHSLLPANQKLNRCSFPPTRNHAIYPSDTLFLFPDSVLSMDAGEFRADLKIIDPDLSASLPDWPQRIGVPDLRHILRKNKVSREYSLLRNHTGLQVKSSGNGTVLIGKNLTFLSMIMKTNDNML